MLRSFLSRLNPVCHHSGKEFRQTDAIKQNNRHVDIGQSCEMTIIGSLLRQARYNALYTHIHQILYISFLVFVQLMRSSDNHKIPISYRHILYTTQYGRKEMRYNFRYYHPYNPRSVLPKAHSKRIGTIVHLPRQLLGPGTKFTTDFRAILQSS